MCSPSRATFVLKNRDRKDSSQGEEAYDGVRFR